MKALFFAVMMLVGCATTAPVAAPAPVPAPQKPAQVQKYKYTTGDCVKFNSAVMAKKGKKTDGTVMFILGYMRAQNNPKQNTAVRYAVVMAHPRMDEPTYFNAVIKVFDEETDKVACPK